LNGQINENKVKRNSEIPKAKKIVAEFTDTFAKWCESLDVVPVVAKLVRVGMDLASAEVKRYAKDFDKADREKLQLFAEALVKKILHGPISFIKKDGSEDIEAEQLAAIELVNKMFLSQDSRE